MALDKQRILSELGNVVNQLQNADCGCMGKMFSNPNQAGNCLGNPLPTCGGCRRGTCAGHGYSVNPMTGAGDPYGGRMGGGMDTGGGMNAGMGMHGGEKGMCGGGMGMHAGRMGMHGGRMGMHGGEMGMHRNGMGAHDGGMGMQGGGMGMQDGGMEMQGDGVGMQGEMGGGGMGMGGGGMGMGRGGMRMGAGRMGMGGGGMESEGGGMGMEGGGMGMGGGGMGMVGGAMDMGGSGMGIGGGGMGMGGGRMGMSGHNAPKLYADTYNFLNKNLMQPVMQEVYNDLKTITPENTVGNNLLAAKMGLPMNQGGAGGNPAAPGMDGVGSMQPMAAMGGRMAMQGMGAPSSVPTGDMGNMGAQIVNMMMSGGRGKTPKMQPGNLGQQMSAPDPNLSGMNPNQPQSGMGNTGQGNPTAMMQNPVTQYVTSDQTGAQGMMPQGNAMGGSMPANNGINPAMQNANPTMQQNMGNTPKQMTSPYGQHTAGITKFNEMFPGVTQGGGLNFDPMAIAMQMNPANERQSAMNQITKLMNGQKVFNPAAAVPQNQIPNQQIPPQPGQTGAYPGANQQVYAAQGNPAMAQQIPQQQIPQGQYQGQIDPNMVQQGIVDPNEQIEEQSPQDPSNPINAPPQQIYYNTLGQPINMVHPDTYPKQMQGLPQTLGGMYGRGEYGVKNTMSKTALAATIPVGKAASKSQLKHIYRQYKASHSQQNFRVPTQQTYTGSQSLAQLNTAPVEAHPTLTANPNAVVPQQMQQIPVEQVGGDTIANNQQLKMEQLEQPVGGKIGDVPPSNFQAGDAATPVMPVGNLRNGLQDMKFSRYHASAAWSFHG